MASSERVYRNSIRAFSLVFILLGIAILISTIARGGGPLSLGVVMGLAFLAVGIARGWLGGGGPPWRRAPKASEHMGEAAETGPAGSRPRATGPAGAQPSAGNGTRGQFPS